MVKHIRADLKIRMLFVVFCMLFCSCTDNEIKQGEQNYLTLKVALLQDENYDMSQAKSGDPVPGTAEEERIETLKFFVYASGALEHYKSITIAPDGTSTDPMWDATNKTLRLIVTPGAKNIYCIANWTDTDPEMPLIDNSSVASESALNARIRYHYSGTGTGITPANPPVMTGFGAYNLTGAETSPSVVQLTRQIARVELEFKLSEELTAIGGSNITVDGVKFCYLAPESYLFPHSPVASPAWLSSRWDQTGYSGTASAVLTETKAFYGTYYIPESVPEIVDEYCAVQMAIKTTYNGSLSYYMLVIDPSLSTSYQHTRYVIERNHTYKYTITIQGVGYSYDPTLPNRSDAGADNPAGITYELEIK